MPTYRVVWEIDIEACAPIEAAKKALQIQRDPNSIATVFDVGERKQHVSEYMKIDLADYPGGLIIPPPPDLP